jgi:TPR repeat protein
MNCTFKAAVAAIILLSLAAPVTAGPFEDAAAAYGRGDYATALRLFRPLADQGNALAQSSLGEMYAFGEGVPKNYAEALKWYRKAADQGYASAQTGLGEMYAFGMGVPQNGAEAVKWSRLAAEQGYAPGQYALGVIYDEGLGVPKDYVNAHMWFNLAAAQGYQVAVKNRDLVEQRMAPAQIAEAQKLAREWKSKSTPR